MRRLHRRRGRRRSILGRALDVFGVIALFGLVAVAAAVFDEISMRDVTGRARVVDGDTIALLGQRIRLAGIDAPEAGQQCRRDGAAYDCGQEARLRLAGLIGDGEVACRGNERDRYGRLLMRCVRGATDLNAAMVRSGWAVAYGDYDGEERQARSEAAGLWAGDFDRPSRWRRQQGSIADIGPAGLASRIWLRVRSLWPFQREDEVP
ncbi:MAG: nuclease [Ahrensia sp.]|nr:nuclease [Ahrensia sp.]